MKAKRKKSKKTLILLLLISLCLVIAFFFKYTLGTASSVASENKEENNKTEMADDKKDKDDEKVEFQEKTKDTIIEEDKQEEVNDKKTEFQNLKKSDLRLEITSFDLNSKAACLMDAQTGEIIYSQFENDREYPASLTKMMTIYAAIKDIKDYKKTYTFRSDMIQKLIQEDASMAGFVAGEKVDAEDLIFGTLLPSGGEAALGLAELVSGSEQAHVEKMNKLVEEMGLANTHFSTVTGLHDEKTYSTAKELAFMLKTMLEDKEFLRVFTKGCYNTSPTPEHKDGIALKYSCLVYRDAVNIKGYDLQGGKTGFTEEAGLCLASTAIVQGRRYVLITLGAHPIDGIMNYHFRDASTVYTALKNALDKKHQ